MSKTFSTILYKELNDFIVDYNLRLDPSRISSDVIKCSKIIYWTIDMKKDTLETVNKTIMSQLLPI